jgi:peptidoglycan/LPS O-acetylase OafA/YrhL
MRGVAALFVVIRHTADFWHLGFFRSYLAVDMFFILSGFVIAFAYDKKIKGGIISFKQFVLIRMIRLYPVFLLSLILSAVWMIDADYTSGESLSAILKLIVLTSLFIPSMYGDADNLFMLNIPYWSLLYELVANFAYALVRPVLSPRVLMLVVAVFGVFIAGIAFRHGNLNMGFGWGATSVIAGVCRAIFGVFFGLLLHRSQASMAGKLSKVPPWVAFAVMTLVLASPSAGYLDPVVDVMSVALLFPMAVLVASCGVPGRAQGVMLALGSASYPIYVLHKPIADLLTPRLGGLTTSFAPASGVLLLMALFAFSVWVEKIYDIPIRRWLSGMAFRSPPAAARMQS